MMKLQSPLLIIFVCAAFCLPAVAQAKSYRPTLAQAPPASEGPAVLLPGPMVQNQALMDAQKAGNMGSFTQQQVNFLDVANRRLRFENEIADLEGKKGVNEKVKKFADYVFQKNGYISYELDGVADAGYFMAIGGISQRQQSEKVKVVNAQRGQVDPMFLRDVVQWNHKLIAEFQQAMNSNDPQIRTVAKNNLPILQETLEKAQSLERRIG